MNDNFTRHSHTIHNRIGTISAANNPDRWFSLEPLNMGNPDIFGAFILKSDLARECTTCCQEHGQDC